MSIATDTEATRVDQPDTTATSQKTPAAPPPAVMTVINPAAPIRAAVLTRLSQFHDSTTSPERQRNDSLRLIDQKGWRCDPSTDIYEDIDVSGYKPSVRRPGLERLIANIHDYDVIVFWKLDRVFRSVLAFLKFVELCIMHNIQLVSVKEDIDTSTPIGKALTTILAIFAEMESLNTSLRVKSAQEHMVKSGYWRGGPTKYGWMPALVSPDDRAGRQRLVLDPEQAPNVMQMATDYLAGRSMAEIARRLNEAGITTAKDKKWTDTTVRGVLTSPMLAGYAIWHGELVFDKDGLPLRPHEPLLDPLTYQELQVKLRARSQTQRQRNESLLGGLIRCSHCGKPMSGRANPKDRQESYSCSTKHMEGPSACPGNNVSCLNTEDYVLEALFARLTPEKLAEARAALAAEKKRAMSPSPEDLEITRLTHQLQVLEKDRMAGIYDTDEDRYYMQYREISDRRHRLQARQPASADPDLGQLDGLDLRSEWRTYDRAKQRSILGAAINRIDIIPIAELGYRPTRGRFTVERIRIDWN